MDKNLVEVVLVVDRSGSMAGIANDASGGINALIEDRKVKPEKTLITLAQFDTEYELVHNGVPADQVPKYVLKPRGGTALYDAIGRTINDVGNRLGATPEDKRPGLVIFVIVTDGEENSSREFKAGQIKSMIEHQTNKYNWQFNYIGADQDAITVAKGIGIASANSASYTRGNSSRVYGAVMKKVSRDVQTYSSTGMVGTSGFTDEERQDLTKDDKNT